MVVSLIYVLSHDGIYYSIYITPDAASGLVDAQGRPLDDSMLRTPSRVDERSTARPSGDFVMSFWTMLG